MRITHMRMNTKTSWDFTKQVNNVILPQGNHARRRDVDQEELKNAVKGFWEQLPRPNRVTFVYNGFIRFDSIAFIDDKGDSKHKCPHLFVDFHSERGPFSGGMEYLEFNEHHRESLEGLKRAKVFPEKFAKPRFGTIHKDKSIGLDARTRATLKHNSAAPITLYYAEKKYGYLKPTDVIGVEGTQDKDGQKTLLKVTNVRTVPGKELLESCAENPPLKQEIETQISRELQTGDNILVVEALILYDWQIEQNRPVV